MFSVSLSNAFRKASSGARGEVELFRALICAFNSLGKDVLAKEYHGNNHQVTFTQARGAGRTAPRCELCDVMIVSYPQGNSRAARVTFNQMKVSDTVFDCSGWIKSKNIYRFRANLEQWDLLSNRPSIRPATATFQPPSGLLKDAMLPSAGSFGVFYPSATGYEIAYFVADALTPLNNNHSRSGTLQWNTQPLSRRNIQGHEEVIGTCCLAMFAEHLENGFIGTPLVQLLNGPSSPQYNRAWINHILISLRDENPESTLPGELLEGLELRPELDSETLNLVAPMSPRAVVLVRTSQRRQEFID